MAFTYKRRTKPKNAFDINTALSDPGFLSELASRTDVDLKRREKKANFLERALGLLTAVGSVPDVVYDVKYRGMNPGESYLENIGQGIKTTFKGDPVKMKFGQDLLKRAGVFDTNAPVDKVGRFIGGLGIDVFADPTTYVTLGGASLTKQGARVVAGAASKTLAEKAGKEIGEQALERALRKGGVNQGLKYLTSIGVKDSDNVLKSLARTQPKVKALNIAGQTVTDNKVIAEGVNALANPLGATVRGTGAIGKKIMPNATEALEDAFSKAFNMGKFAKKIGQEDLFNEAKLARSALEGSGGMARTNTDFLTGRLAKAGFSANNAQSRVAKILETPTIEKSAYKAFKKNLSSTGAKTVDDKIALLTTPGNATKYRELGFKYLNDTNEAMIKKSGTPIISDDALGSYLNELQIDKVTKSGLSKLEQEPLIEMVQELTKTGIARKRAGIIKNVLENYLPRQVVGYEPKFLEKTLGGTWEIAKRDRAIQKSLAKNQDRYVDVMALQKAFGKESGDERIFKMLSEAEDAGVVYNQNMALTFQDYMVNGAKAFQKKEVAKRFVKIKDVNGNDALIHKDKFKLPKEVVEGDDISSIQGAKTKGKSFDEWVKEDGYDGRQIANEAKQLGSDQGGFDEFTLNKIKKESYFDEEIPIKDLRQADPDLDEYLKAFGVREFEGEPFGMNPIVSSNGEVLDGYNRIAQAIEDGQESITVLRGKTRSQLKAEWDKVGDVVKQADKYMIPKNYRKLTIEGLEDYYVEREAFNMVESFFKDYTAEEGTATVIRYYDRFLSAFKKLVTGFGPNAIPYNVRNAFGDASNMMIGGWGVRNGKFNAVAAKKSADIGMKAQQLENHIRKFGLKSAKEKYSDEVFELYERGMMNGIIGGSQVADEMGRTITRLDVPEQLKGQKDLFRNAKRGLANMFEKPQRLRENSFRYANLYDHYKQLGNWDAAGAMAKLSSLDYANLTNFEKNFMRRLIPFYSFFRQNIELQFKVLNEKPGVILAQQKFFRNLAGALQDQTATQEDNSILPDWMTEDFFSITNKVGDTASILTSFGDPTSALNDYLGSTPAETLGKVLGNASPLVKIGVEQATGKNMFKDINLEDDTAGERYKHYPQFMKDLLGYREYQQFDKDGKPYTIRKVDPGKKYALESLPGLSSYDVALKRWTDLLVEKENTPQDLANLFSGVKSYTTDLGVEKIKREQELSEEIGKILVNYGVARQKRGIYLNPQLESNAPEVYQFLESIGYRQTKQTEKDRVKSAKKKAETKSYLDSILN